MRFPLLHDRSPALRVVVAVAMVGTYAVELSLMAWDPPSAVVATMPLILLTLSAFEERIGRPVLVAFAAVGASMVATLFVHSTILQRTFGLIELVFLIVLAVTAARHASPRQRLALGVLLCAALAVLPQRSVTMWWNTVELAMLLILSGIGAIALGVFLREEDLRRSAMAHQVRRAERMDLASDLHDHVAHYVTAMVVQAQAGGEIVEGDPATGRQLFANIESVGQDGLAAMSRMVGLLREGAQSDADRTVPQGLAALHEQVARFSAVGPQASLDVDAAVDPAGWSPELSRSVQRLVQEGLTNVRKHASNATSVRVMIGASDEDVVVRVRNDGTRTSRPRFRASGFGLIGLQERVSVLGGSLSSAALPEGGWELRATLPVGRTTSAAAAGDHPHGDSR
ncbi:sensor histidine kinase [Actinoalloteichus hymeniacidonis]|uniref:histidine kinase n=1 Tax=Actinoalloteichus hymeniacidonis TaxID=340345 RepID=A0AAC9HMU5_9PSEU|nr:histidine kinase [Actinoalloteichus hymeniacidonis]AOS62096.1 signal transduction histidine kinase [Actinoalloteichus hymeniacidonis]MBB5909882.1 signal transduction histidine kinase [Actinoalloteichus hymeniacidonis]